MVSTLTLALECRSPPEVVAAHKLTACSWLRGDITPEERREWIDAVLCLLDTPSKLDPATYPGAKNRYDDFVVVHMNQTLTIHGTVSSSSE